MTESLEPHPKPTMALIDADVLLYEVSAIAEDRETGEVRHFDFVKEVFDGRVSDIVKATGVDDYELYITGEGNFRIALAQTKPYKGNRKEEKPFHYYNLKAYMEGHHKCTVTEGMEADDMMCVRSWSEPDTYVICTRDKDLRMLPGWHYGWECGRQPEFKMQYVTDPGHIQLSSNRREVKGTGSKFFWSQMLTGDKVDNIPGLEGWGAVAAADLLMACQTEEDMASAVIGAYQMMGDNWEEYMLEQGRLLWMVREVDENGPVMWEIPNAGQEIQQRQLDTG